MKKNDFFENLVIVYLINLFFNNNLLYYQYKKWIWQKTVSFSLFLYLIISSLFLCHYFYAILKLFEYFENFDLLLKLFINDFFEIFYLKFDSTKTNHFCMPSTQAKSFLNRSNRMIRTLKNVMIIFCTLCSPHLRKGGPAFASM